MGESYPRFPLFIDLQGKKIVVVGGGTVASRRIGALQSFGGEIAVIAPVWQTPLPQVLWVKRDYQQGDLAGATLVIAATNQRAVNAQVAQDATKQGSFVSVADDPKGSTFYFPALCQGDGVVAGVVSTEGDHHQVVKVAKDIRKLLEQEG